MKLEDLVVSVEIAKKLKELGVKQDSFFYWCKSTTKDKYYLGITETPYDKENILYEIRNNLNNNTVYGFGCECCNDYFDVEKENYSAFTVAELGELLPCKIDKYDLIMRKVNQSYLSILVYYEDYPQDYNIPYLVEFEDKTEADARAKLLIYLIENKKI